MRVIAYSDGHDGAVPEGTKEAAFLKSHGILIETLGLGKAPNDVNESFLKSVCTTDDAVHYRFLGDATSIHETFEKLGTGATLTFEG